MTLRIQVEAISNCRLYTSFLLAAAITWRVCLTVLYFTLNEPSNKWSCSEDKLLFGL